MSLFNRQQNNEEYEQEIMYEEESDQQADKYGMAVSVERPHYGSEEFAYFNDVASSKFLRGIIEMISQKHITTNLKQQYMATITELLSQDELLGNNTKLKQKFETTHPVKINAIEAELMLLNCFAIATTHDLQVFNMFGYNKVIIKNYKTLLSRTVGQDRERRIMTELKTVSSSMMEPTLQIKEQQQVKKKGLFKLW